MGGGVDNMFKKGCHINKCRYGNGDFVKKRCVKGEGWSKEQEV